MRAQRLILPFLLLVGSTRANADAIDSFERGGPLGLLRVRTVPISSILATSELRPGDSIRSIDGYAPDERFALFSDLLDQFERRRDPSGDSTLTLTRHVVEVVREGQPLRIDVIFETSRAVLLQEQFSRLADVTVMPEAAPRGVRLFFYSVAGRADPLRTLGLKQNDVLKSINGVDLSTNDAILAARSRVKPGEVADLEVVRDGHSLRVRATLD